MGIAASTLLALAIASGRPDAPPAVPPTARAASECDLARFGIRYVRGIQSDTPPATEEEYDPCAPLPRRRPRPEPRLLGTPVPPPVDAPPPSVVPPLPPVTAAPATRVCLPDGSSLAGSALSPGLGGTLVAARTGGDRRQARRNREMLVLRSLSVRDAVRPGPAGSITTPTAAGLETGEVYAGVSYQARTRYTQNSDAGAAIATGLGSRDIIAAEFALTTYSTLRGAGPLETGALSVKLHRSLPRETSIAVGVENAALWGDSDTERSYYGVVSHITRRVRDSSRPFSSALISVGVGDGRFRSENAISNRRKETNVFGSVGVRVIEPMSFIADWTGQDLNVAASFTPFRRQPLVITPGLADVTGNAGDGVRFILGVGYVTALRRPF
ncbi:hypothetical protein [Longimicrobium terrae]|uniref:Uncharacterized protein n=1 Tax=Longimicrobium terrae TaxID=1639882 RepID=A0A841GUX4_9BACT|nr:hypothetical protein [Longimicrobium terrae]MBB4634705.1 hypothetical protein [Longimicrobium terrae]MBB6068405.1 hypothetical protein [Longimicrobium terrae]NNC32685.1 hypothetical protein [Longimicrobium terrae]